MKSLRRCRNNFEADNVVLIDVDTYHFNNVIDIPESQSKKQGRSNAKNRPLRTLIYIDDDDDENTGNDHDGADLDCERKVENVASSSRRYVPDNNSPLKLSKGKRTYSGRGFNAELDSDSSDDDDDDDDQDSVFFEDFSGKLKEQWEKACLKRKAVVQDSNIDGTSHVEKDENITCDVMDVDGGKYGSPVDESPFTNEEENNEKANFDHTPIIDDDGDDDENPCNDHDGADLDGERKFDNVASSSGRFGLDNSSPLKPSKGKRTYSGRGFNAELDSDSSSDDDEDCEFLGDSSGKLKEQLEKTCLKRKAVVQDFNIDGTSHVEKGESVTCDDVDGHKYDLPVGESPSTSEEENNEKANFDNTAIIDNDVDYNDVESSIIDQREKLKETDEYKRALEEELVAREKALKIQAEEAQQLRRMQKRKKAECLRLLDMERRQKQRVEEIRETQKKDEENMNLKEQYRTEVRHELKKLEISCVDMASLLLGLGIQVGKGPVPSSHEVRAAYKRALLSFHPDRASGSDMRQQVEAEEKFKLISRMKEKFSL